MLLDTPSHSAWSESRGVLSGGPIMGRRGGRGKGKGREGGGEEADGEGEGKGISK